MLNPLPGPGCCDVMYYHVGSRWIVRLQGLVESLPSISSNPSCSRYSCTFARIYPFRLTEFARLNCFRTLDPCLIRCSVLPSPPFFGYLAHVASMSCPWPLTPLAECFSIGSSSYDGIRPANPGDIPGIREIIAPLEEAGWVSVTLLPATLMCSFGLSEEVAGTAKRWCG